MLNKSYRQEKSNRFDAVDGFSKALVHLAKAVCVGTHMCCAGRLVMF